MFRGETNIRFFKERTEAPKLPQKASFMIHGELSGEEEKSEDNRETT